MKRWAGIEQDVIAAKLGKGYCNWTVQTFRTKERASCSRSDTGACIEDAKLSHSTSVVQKWNFSLQILTGSRARICIEGNRKRKQHIFTPLCPCNSGPAVLRAALFGINTNSDSEFSQGVMEVSRVNT